MRDWPPNPGTGKPPALDRRPTPFYRFIRKIRSRRNPACKYCYMYEMAGSGWHSRPQYVPQETFAAAAGRIPEHVHPRRLDGIESARHGGEPLHEIVPRVRPRVDSATHLPTCLPVSPHRAYR